LAFDTVDEAMLKEYFKELDVKSATIVRDSNGKSKGHGYIEFHKLDGLQKALQVHGMEFEGRILNADVAPDRRSHTDDKSRWGGSPSPSFGERNYPPASSAARRPGNFDNAPDDARPWRSTISKVVDSRPKLELKPRGTTPVDGTSGRQTKISLEDPFGGASDPEKLQKQAEERARRETEADQKRTAQLDKIKRERDEAASRAEAERNARLRTQRQQGVGDKIQEGNGNWRTGPSSKAGRGGYAAPVSKPGNIPAHIERPRPAPEQPSAKTNKKEEHATVNPFSVLGGEESI